MRSFFDTNLLVYADASDEPVKQKRAIHLIKTHRAAGTAVLSTQVLQEYVNVALRKLHLPLPLIRERLSFYARFDLVPATPEPPEPTLTPFPTPRTAQNLPVRKLVDGQIPGRGANAPTIVPTATPRPVALDMQIFNDNNRNGLLDPGEGINGTSIRILDEASGTPLGQTATDGEGRARFTIFNEGPVRVSVPMFGYSTLINEPQATVRIALIPSEQLPARIP